MMTTPTVKETVTVERTIQMRKPIDAKTFQWAYSQVMKAIEEDGVDLRYDDAFFVRVDGTGLHFSYPKPEKETNGK